ncbi:MAG: spore germination protein [Oscillospiraceae bacterium]|nr:spore germination protein [Oscillospiraceae bacterium]MDY4192276.1 spore germination protein [Oscillospiraceae bacterium]
MFGWIRHKIERERRTSYVPSGEESGDVRFTGNSLEDMIGIRSQLSGTSDFMVREVTVCGISVHLLMFEGMFNLQTMTEILIEPLTSLALEGPSPQKLLQWVRGRAVLGADQNEVYTASALFPFLMAGFVGVMIDGVEPVIVVGIQGYNFRSISEPSAETNVRGSREGFTEPIRINMTMIRRRIKSPTLVMKLRQAGGKSKTDLCLVYLSDMVSPEILREVEYRLSQVSMDTVLESGYIQPFLDTRRPALFSNVGTTERPDTLCAKVSEGRIGVLVDGTPFALIVPYFFNEHFQSIDDYAGRPYYAAFNRWLKYLAFFFTILLPGVYVAVGTFHPELFPESLLLNIAAAEESTPFPLMLEALIIHFIYELMREAGLRLPRPVGHAVSIVGALVIGDAAVTAGIIGSPMVMVVALTAISSFVVPSLYEPVTVLRFAFIVIGGWMGLYGITLGLALVLVNICGINAYGVPASSPESPFQLFPMRDVLIRLGWRKLGKEKLRVQKLPGSEL